MPERSTPSSCLTMKKAVPSMCASARTGRIWSAPFSVRTANPNRSVPTYDSLTPDELTLELAEKLFSTPQEGRSLGVNPETGHEVVAKDGRYGPYVTEVLPEPI